MRRERFGAAAALAARHRVDLNLLVDYGWPRFLSRADAFVRDVDDPDVIMELIEVLETRDTTAAGGVYAHLPKPPAAPGGGSGGEEEEVEREEMTALMAGLGVSRSEPEAPASGVGVGKISAVCAAVRAALEVRVAGGGLLDDRWELVVLSTHARSEPPDLHAALTRVSRRRKAELAAAATGTAGGGGLDSAAALKHLLTLMGGEQLYDAALGTYDLSVAYLVGQHAQMDPGEFVPDLKRLQDLPEPLRKADIDKRCGRHARCIEHLLQGGDVVGACEVAARRRLFPHALAAASSGDHGPKEAKREVAKAYAVSLASERRHEDAAVTLLSAGDAPGALEQYREALAWRPALALAARLKLSPPERRTIAEELAEGMEHTDPAAAAAVAAQHLGDVDRAVGLLCRAREWRECTRVAYLHDRGDLVETTLAPAAAEAASGILTDALEAPARAAKYLARLRDLKRHREALASAVEAGAAAWRGGGGGRPGGFEGDDDDDDGASEAPSLASGMSAYTDRTLGAQTATTASGSSRVPSTQVGLYKANHSLKGVWL